MHLQKNSGLRGNLWGSSWPHFESLWVSFLGLKCKQIQILSNWGRHHNSLAPFGFILKSLGVPLVLKALKDKTTGHLIIPCGSLGPNFQVPTVFAKLDCKCRYKAMGGGDGMGRVGQMGDVCAAGRASDLTK